METKLLNAENEQDIQAAATILRSGGLVALPTETVYGLGANALDEGAVAGIFKAKGRPQDNPLIIHISSFEQADEVGFPNRLALDIAKAFCPGPITIVIRKKPCVPTIVSAGLDTVGVRIPNHRVALELIKSCGFPIAAPSANSSGRPSPTRADHVLEDMSGKIHAVLDGGSCQIGLESTVVDATGDMAVILRPGAVTEEMLIKALGKGRVYTKKGEADKNAVPKAPGMKYRHYAPKAPVVLVCGSPHDSYDYILKNQKDNEGVLVFSEYLEKFAKNTIDFGYSYDKKHQGKVLFAALRAFDTLGVSKIYIQCPREKGEGSALYNRLKKAADGNIVKATQKQIIGVTGRSGSGKSYISQKMADEQGAFLINADRVYSQMLENCTAMLWAMKKAFPTCFKDEGLEKTKLRELVFENSSQLEKLNKITHPHIINEILTMIDSAKEESVIIDAPTLFESGLDKYCTLIIGVVCSDEVAVKRIMSRDGISEEQGKKRLENQHKQVFFERYCDKILENL